MISEYIIRAQEEERKRLSRDLHDGIGQTLYSILVGLKVIQQVNMDEMMRNHLYELQQMVARTLQDVKNMAVDLRPSALDDLGLAPALRSFMKRFEQTFGIEVSLEIQGTTKRYASSIETSLYRICQEAFTNAAKYADTDKILVQLINQEDKVELCIQDFGKGFNTESVEINGTGLGLYGMKERASLLSGQVNIISNPGEGTIIRVVIPLKESEEADDTYPNVNC